MSTHKALYKIGFAIGALEEIKAIIAAHDLGNDAEFNSVLKSLKEAVDELMKPEITVAPFFPSCGSSFKIDSIPDEVVTENGRICTCVKGLPYTSAGCPVHGPIP